MSYQTDDLYCSLFNFSRGQGVLLNVTSPQPSTSYNPTQEQKYYSKLMTSAHEVGNVDGVACLITIFYY